MSELYGAPSGIIASDSEIRSNIHAGLLAQKTLGEIEQQPAELRLKTAHARLYESEAGLKESQMRDQQMLQQLEQGIVQARNAGVDLSVADARQVVKPQSMAAQLENVVTEGVKRGVPARLTLPYAEKAAHIRQQEAAAASSKANEVIHLIDAQKKQAERRGMLAQMGMQGPQQYAQMLQTAAEEGLPVDHLPQEWGGPAVQQLQGIVKSSLTVKESLELARKDLHEKAQEARWRSSSARDSASIGLAIARRDLTNERLSVLRKNGGDGSPEVHALREERRQNSIAVREARERKEFPPIPLSQSAVKPDQAYTLADGTRARAVEDPNGTIKNLQGKILSLVRLPGVAKGAKVKPAAAELDDEEED